MYYKKIGTMLLFSLFIFVSAYSQESVLRLVAYNGTVESYVNEQIVADTIATGGFLADRVYELGRDSIFLHNAIFNVPIGKTLRLRAEAGSGKRPVIYLWETGTGGTPTRPPGNFTVLNGGDLEMRNICIAGYYEYEPDRITGVQGGLINVSAIGSSITLDSVILSNINGQIVRVGSTFLKVSITNSIFANMGSLTTSNLGAGKGIDFRDAAGDTVIIERNTFVNYQDRAIRHYNYGSPLVGTGIINYAKIDHNTFVNGMGFHGLFSLGNVGSEIIITNNLFVDGFGLGEDSTDATRAAEWANTLETYPNGNNRITWIFSAPNDTTVWTIGKNYFAISDSGQLAFLDLYGYGPACPLSWHINSRLNTLGTDTLTVFQQKTLSLVNIPKVMTVMERWYEAPDGGNRLKEQTNYVYTRDDYDRRTILYYRDTMNAKIQASGAVISSLTTTDAVVAGDPNWGTPLTGIENAPQQLPSKFALSQNYPNPFNPSTGFTYELSKAGIVSIKVYDILGREVATLVNEFKQAGSYPITWDASSFSSGIYFYKMQSGSFTATKKMILMK